MVFSLYLLNSMVHFAFFVRKPTSFLNKTQSPSCKATVSSGSIPYSEGKGNVRELTLYLWDLENSYADSLKNICWVPLCAKHCAEDTVLKKTVWDKVPTSLSFGPNRTYRQTGRVGVMCQVAGASGENQPKARWGECGGCHHTDTET